MLFKLGAQLGSNFNGTFSSAQQVLQKTQREIQNLNQQQGNISAYQRQQQSIKGTEEKLALYQKQLENVRSEMQSSGSSSSDLANKELALQQRIKDTERTLQTKNERLAQMRDKMSEAGVDVNNLTSESARLRDEMQALQRQEEQAGQEAAQFGDKGATAVEDIASALASAGIVGALKQVYDGFKGCVDISMEFGSTMSTVEALSGATSSEMAQLTQTAKDFGANTAFTANEAAQAMSYMGMAGWNAGQMMSGMDGVINLAAASGEDLANVSDIVTDNLTAFGLKAEDTAHFSDVLAAAATNSNTSVGIMGETFSGSAAIAGALGYSIEDVATAVGAMANAGVKGSVAGTALKNTFNGLLNGATLTSEAFGEVEYTAINADGTMKSFGDTVQELRGYFDQMTESERVQNAMALAGQRGYNGLLAILNTSGEEYAALTDKITNCTGAAKRMSEIKLDNLKGDVTLMDSAADGLRTTLGGLWENEGRQLVQFGTEVLGNVNTFIEENPALVKGIMAAGGVIGGVTAAYMALNAVKKAKHALDAIGLTLTASQTAAASANAAATGAEAAATAGATVAQKGFNLALLASPIGIATAGVAVLTGALVAYSNATKDAAFEDRELNAASDEQYQELDRLNREYETACARHGNMSQEALSLKYDLDEATAAIDSQKFSVSDLYAEIDSLHTSTADLISQADSGADTIDDNYKTAKILAAKLHDLAGESENTATAQGKIEPIINRLNELYPNLGLTVDNFKSKLDGLDGSIEKSYSTTGLKAKADSAREYYDELIAQQAELQSAVDKAQKTRDAAAKNFTDLVDYKTFDGKWAPGLALDALTDKIPGLTSATGDAERAFDDADAKLQTAKSDLAELNAKIAEQESIIDEYNGVVSGTSDKIISLTDGTQIALSQVADSATALMESYNNAYQAAYESISGQYKLWDDAADVSEMDVADINDSLSLQADYWSDYNTNIENLLGKTGQISGLRDVIATFADGSSDSVDAIAGMASASDDDLKTMVENWKKLQEAQKNTSDNLAEVKTDFASHLTELQNDVTAKFKGLNLETEAKSAAEATVQAYADGLVAGKGSVESAADIVKSALIASLGFAANVDENVNSDGGGGFRPVPHSDGGGGFTPERGYAVGTYNALSGLALVGERGPELVNFNGGEQVLTAETTRALMAKPSGGSATITLSPTFQINGNMDEDMLRQCTEQLVDMIVAVLDERGIDARRGRYE